MRQYLDFTGKHVVITGAGGGVGGAAAYAFAENGADVYMIDVNAGGMNQVKERIQKDFGREATAITCDLTQEQDIEKTVREILGKTDHIEILVNCAGVSTGDKPGQDMTVWHKTMGINLTGPWMLIKSFLPVMVDQKYGRILNVSSINAYRAMKYIPLQPYYASKTGIIGLTRGIAAYYGKFGITCNAISPGLVETQMVSAWTPELRAQYCALSPVERGAEPEELCSVILFLCSESAGYINGVDLSVDGGMRIA